MIEEADSEFGTLMWFIFIFLVILILSIGGSC